MIDQSPNRSRGGDALAWLTPMLAFSLSACSNGGTPISSADVPDTGSTASVLCGISGTEYNSDESVRLTAHYSWACDGATRTLTGNGVPNHEVGTFPNEDNPNTLTATTVSASYTLTPAYTDVITSAPRPGFAINGVKFDPGTGGSCNDAGDDCPLGPGGGGQWRIEALGQSSFRFGEDENNAHVQPTGEYHYHGMPEHYITKLGGGASSMTLVGWASDGFPVYARYGYSVATDANSGVVPMIGSYQLKSTPDSGRPSTSTYPMGAFTQDYEYVAGSGDLDECNGRVGVTPEFPSGTYYYAITDTYPFIQRCLKGTASAGTEMGPPPGG